MGFSREFMSALNLSAKIKSFEHKGIKFSLCLFKPNKRFSKTRLMMAYRSGDNVKHESFKSEKEFYDFINEYSKKEDVWT